MVAQSAAIALLLGYFATDYDQVRLCTAAYMTSARNERQTETTAVILQQHNASRSSVDRSCASLDRLQLQLCCRCRHPACRYWCTALPASLATAWLARVQPQRDPRDACCDKRASHIVQRGVDAVASVLRCMLSPLTPSHFLAHHLSAVHNTYTSTPARSRASEFTPLEQRHHGLHQHPQANEGLGLVQPGR